MFLTFLFFKFLIFFFCILLISSRGVMLSLLNLTGIVSVLVFFSFLFNFDFIAMIFLIVYMGAVTVLFLFVLMMLHLKKGSFNDLLLNTYFFSIILVFSLGWLFFFKMGFNFKLLIFLYNDFFFQYIDFFKLLNFTENIKVLGNLLYTFFFLEIIIVTLILLVGMIGSIILVLDFYIFNNDVTLS